MLVLHSLLKKSSAHIRVLIDTDFIACFCSNKTNSDGATSDKTLSAQAQRALWASQWIQCIM